MDRYQGLGPMSEEEAYAATLLQLERIAWESDRRAIAEYESWFLHKTILEADRDRANGSPTK